MDVDDTDAKLLKEARKGVPFDAENKEHAAALKKAKEAQAKAEKEAEEREKKAKSGD
jgi:cbb3-type cytochrome oxidase cytochrome c subunit